MSRDMWFSSLQDQINSNRTFFPSVTRWNVKADKLAFPQPNDLLLYNTGGLGVIYPPLPPNMPACLYWRSCIIPVTFKHPSEHGDSPYCHLH